MRRLHEATVLVGLAGLAAMMSAGHFPEPALLGFALLVLVVVSFAVSLTCAMWLTLRPRSTALPARSVFSYFAVAVGSAFMLVALVNDLWIPLSSPQQFAVFIFSLCVLFVVPWVVADFRILRRTPVGFDAGVVPFLAMGLYQLTASRFAYGLWWRAEFWLLFGFPTFLITFIVMHRALVRKRSTVVPLSIATGILYLLLQIHYDFSGIIIN